MTLTELRGGGSRFFKIGTKPYSWPYMIGGAISGGYLQGGVFTPLLSTRLFPYPWRPLPALTAPNHEGVARLSLPGWVVKYQDGILATVHPFQLDVGAGSRLRWSILA